MIYVSSVQAFYHELAREAKVFANSQCFFIYVLRAEVLCNTAVVSVGQLSRVYLIIEQVIHVHIVHIALN